MKNKENKKLSKEEIIARLETAEMEEGRTGLVAEYIERLLSKVSSNPKNPKEGK